MFKIRIIAQKVLCLLGILTSILFIPYEYIINNIEISPGGTIGMLVISFCIFILCMDGLIETNNKETKYNIFTINNDWKYKR